VLIIWITSDKLKLMIANMKFTTFILFPKIKQYKHKNHIFRYVGADLCH
jgi:hypothetical protein